MVEIPLVERISEQCSNIKKRFSRTSFFELNQKRDQELVFKVIGEKKIPSAKQLKYISRFYSDKERLITKIAFSFILVAVIMLGGDLYLNHIVVQPAAGGEYVEAVVGAPTYINPLFAQTNDIDQDISQLVFSGLMRLNEFGQLVGDLAESYTIDETQTTYTFTVREGIKWHDNEPLTAHDVLFTVQSIQDQNFKSPLYITFKNVKARALDDRTITFTLPEPFAPFLSVMTFGILPKHLWQEIDPSHAILAELNLKPIGSGPYQFHSLVKDKKGNIREYRLKRSDDYFLDGPFIENITFKFFPSIAEARGALEQGNVDGLGFLPQNSGYDTTSTGGNSTVQEHTLALPQYTALFFNQGSNAALSELAVRQALALATSKHSIIETVFGGKADPVHAPILPGMVGYDPELPTILFDPAKAEQVLDKAGWIRVEPEPDDEGEHADTTLTPNPAFGLANSENQPYTRVKNVKKGTTTEVVPLEITLTTIQRDENIAVAEIIRDLWQSIGVNVSLSIVEPGKIQKEVIKPRAYEVLLFGQILGRDPDPYPFWHSSQANDPGLNLALYANKDTDKLLEEARQTTDREARQEKYRAFQQKLAEEVPAVFLYSLKYTYLLPKSIQGFETLRINQPDDRFSTVQNWYIKTKKRIKFNF